jgi:hypothetical protein
MRGSITFKVFHSVVEGHTMGLQKAMDLHTGFIAE